MRRCGSSVIFMATFSHSTPHLHSSGAMPSAESRAPSPMPDEPSPMLCTLVDRAFDGPEWTFEPKLDGLRILARFDGKDLTLVSRNNKPQEARFPEIAGGLRAALSGPAIVDGELEDQLGGGVSQFSTTLFNAAWFAGSQPGALRRKPASISSC